MLTSAALSVVTLVGAEGGGESGRNQFHAEALAWVVSTLVWWDGRHARGTDKRNITTTSG